MEHREFNSLKDSAEMSSPFRDGTWADQWDDNPDPLIEEPKKGRGGGGSMGKKVGKGLGKTKAVASSGVKKVKEGTCLGFGWMKSKCHKTPQTLL
ncbi:hypothetical protein RHSIM_Rhsim12G0161300 [Rhododendron simsii]|uniref:Uncharacterized protein n=1 Tax=Rhododendron simsii TaxID=118357 RepID=A0A834L9T2_RHOSS|nr:hypothetical protein RHSIM_Rhsim12G0161300 [Rhododendron simsii]